MKPKYIQVNCREVKKIDLRQAKAVLKHKPDIILLEYPNNNKTSDMIFNSFPTDKKPQTELNKIKKLLKKFSKNNPWGLSDISMWENVEKLWQNGHNVLIYRIDSPTELTNQYLTLKMYKNYPAIKSYWLFWAYLLIRDYTMTKNVKWVIKRYKNKKNPTVLVFLQSIHWDHVKFLLTNPTKKQIWDYYFKNFKEINTKNIGFKIKEKNKIMHKYWKKINLF